LNHPRLLCRSYPNCKEGEVMHCFLPGQRHVWPWWTEMLIHSFNARKVRPMGPWAQFWSAYLNNETNVTDPEMWQHSNISEGMIPVDASVVDKWSLANSSNSTSGVLAEAVPTSKPESVADVVPNSTDHQGSVSHVPQSPNLTLLSPARRNDREPKSLSVFTTQATVHRVLLRS
jgi:hypothetical protein